MQCLKIPSWEGLGWIISFKMIGHNAEMTYWSKTVISIRQLTKKQSFQVYYFITGHECISIKKGTCSMPFWYYELFYAVFFLLLKNLPNPIRPKAPSMVADDMGTIAPAILAIFP
jgi:hypothetical protein